MAINSTNAIPLAEAARRGDLNALGNLLRDLVDTLEDLSDAEIAYLDGITAGTGLVSKATVLDASGNFIMPDNGVFGLSRAALAAAGTTSADAAVIADQVVAITASDGTKGVALPLAATTEGPILLINTVATLGVKVYPVDGGNDNINGEAEDAAVVLGPGQAAWAIPTSATQWYISAAALITSTPAELNILDGVTANAAELNQLDGAILDTLATEAGVGITAGTGTVYKSSVAKVGDIFKTSILIDLTGLSSSATNTDVIGVDDTGAAHLGQITAARNGTIFGGKITCLEAPTTGDPDIDVYAATENTGVEDTLITDLTATALHANGESWTLGMVKALTAVPAANQYLYLTVGNTGAAGLYDAGKFLIELEGY